MQIGVPKEIKDREHRIALAPKGAAALVERGHRVIVEMGAGAGSGFEDQDYVSAGAALGTAANAWAAELVVKVKEPLEPEYALLRDQILFTYLHLSGVTPTLTETLLARGTSAIAYETVEDGQGRLPLLAPMSAIAGNIAVIMGAFHLARFQGGKGTLLGKVLGRRHGKVVVIGDGVVGIHAARAADGLGADVYLFGRHVEREVALKQAISEDITFVLSTPEQIAAHLLDADLLVGAVLRRGARAPMVVAEGMVRAMQPGSVIVDVSIDQGGCIATAHPTSHSAPIYREHEVIHYAVPNMPGAYPRTSTLALTDATLPYVIRLADLGLGALRQDPGFARGLNTHAHHVCYRPVAEDLDLTDRYQEWSADA